MESYACQPYTIPAGSHLLQVFCRQARTANALATLGTSDIAMTRQLQVGVIRPDELDATGWCQCFPPEVQHLLRLNHSAFLRDSNSICFALQPTVRCFLLHAGRSGIGSMPHRSGLTGACVICTESTPQSAPPVGAIDPPPWACAATGHEGPMQAPPLNQPSVFWPDNSPRSWRRGWSWCCLIMTLSLQPGGKRRSYEGLQSSTSCPTPYRRSHWAAWTWRWTRHSPVARFHPHRGAARRTESYRAELVRQIQLAWFVRQRTNLRQMVDWCFFIRMPQMLGTPSPLASAFRTMLLVRWHP